jgi:hypothetical protein
LLERREVEDEKEEEGWKRLIPRRFGATADGESLIPQMQATAERRNAWRY